MYKQRVNKSVIPSRHPPLRLPMHRHRHLYLVPVPLMLAVYQWQTTPQLVPSHVAGSVHLGDLALHEATCQALSVPKLDRNEGSLPFDMSGDNPWHL